MAGPAEVKRLRPTGLQVLQALIRGGLPAVQKLYPPKDFRDVIAVLKRELEQPESE
jgi:hypothetical protein